ncbi:MAG: iron-containing alcohol dehydrogenase [Planctomycetota bacterium]|nr:iron-containing alcohol dehydrogenase [Planctomycetota bacterium]
MPLTYEFAAPRRIVFGSGKRRELGKLVADLGDRAFVIVGSRTLMASGEIGELLTLLQAARVDAILLDTISREPLVTDVNRVAGLLKQQGPRAGDVVIAIGGGSAIDLAKAVVAVAAHPESEGIVDFLEGVGRGVGVTRETLPVVAVPTTAGTGSEATRNAVISSYEPTFKKSIRSERLLPRLVVVDPELALSLPPAVTAATGMDAITQLIESAVSRRRAPIPMALALSGLTGTVAALRVAFLDGSNLAARETMAHAALLSGMALANSGLGLAHGVAAALGVHAQVSHGLACAVMLPVAMRFNLATCETEFAQIGEALSSRKWPTRQAAAEAGLSTIDELLIDLRIPRRLRELGVVETQIAAIARDSKGNSLSGNPRDVSEGELCELLKAMW